MKTNIFSDTEEAVVDVQELDVLSRSPTPNIILSRERTNNFDYIDLSEPTDLSLTNSQGKVTLILFLNIIFL